MKTILLTGGTGFLGSFLAAGLLRNGCKIIFLSRGRNGKSAKQRTREALEFADRELVLNRDQYEVIEGDVTELPDFLPAIKGIDEVWHCAASVSFVEREADMIWRVNVEGTKRVTEFIAKSGIGRLHYFGTAFVCGNRKTIIYEDEFDCSQEFYNTYERSKFEAEKMVRRWSAETGCQTTIYRPSIIVGHYEDGRVPSFTGYYAFMRALYFLQRLISGKMAGNRSIFLKEGIFLEEDYLHLPVRISCLPESDINMVPIDYLAGVVIALSKNKASEGKIFHLTNNNPPAIEPLVTESLRVMRVKGCIFTNDGVGKLRQTGKGYLKLLEGKIHRDLKVYLPYISGEPKFDVGNIKQVLGEYNCPRITNDFIGRMMRYSMDVEFGRKKGGKIEESGN